MARKRKCYSSYSFRARKRRRIDDFHHGDSLRILRSLNFSYNPSCRSREEEILKIRRGKPKPLVEVVKDMIASILKEDHLDNAILKCVTESCWSRLNQVLMNGFHYMQHCNRQRFTVEDFVRGLHFHAVGEFPYLSLYIERLDNEGTKKVDIEELNDEVYTEEGEFTRYVETEIYIILDKIISVAEKEVTMSVAKKLDEVSTSVAEKLYEVTTSVAEKLYEVTTSVTEKLDEVTTSVAEKLYEVITSVAEKLDAEVTMSVATVPEEEVKK